jgi:uncharacterized protein with NRDE domain
MCLVVIAWRAHPWYPLVVAANRDEFHARPAAPLEPWNDAPEILAGRDLQAGGTWLGLDLRGRLGVVTNFREHLHPRRDAPSRGELIPAFLRGGLDPGAYLAALAERAPAYSGFNLLLAAGDELWYASNRDDGFARRLDPGVYGLANHRLDTPWPKLTLTRDRVLAALAGIDARPTPRDEERLVQRLFELLSDRAPAPADASQAQLAADVTTGLPRAWASAVAAPFVLHADYGTRCSTVVVGAPTGVVRVAERRFGPDGDAQGETQVTIAPAEPGR